MSQEARGGGGSLGTRGRLQIAGPANVRCISGRGQYSAPSHSHLCLSPALFVRSLFPLDLLSYLYMFEFLETLHSTYVKLS